MQAPPTASDAHPPPDAVPGFTEPESDDEMSDVDTSQARAPGAPTKVKTTIKVTKLCALLARGLPATVLRDAVAASAHTIRALEELAKTTECPLFHKMLKGARPHACGREKHPTSLTRVDVPGEGRDDGVWAKLDERRLPR